MPLRIARDETSTKSLRIVDVATGDELVRIEIHKEEDVVVEVVAVGRAQAVG